MRTGDPCRPWRETLGPGHKPRWGLFFPAVTREQSPTLPRNSNGRLDFPGPTEEEAWISRCNSRIPPQLEKNHVIPSSSQDAAIAATASQKKSYVPSWSAIRYLAPLMRHQKFPNTLVSLEGNTEVPGITSSVPLLPSWSRQEGRFPCFVCKGSLPSRRTSVTGLFRCSFSKNPQLRLLSHILGRWCWGHSGGQKRPNPCPRRHCYS